MAGAFKIIQPELSYEVMSILFKVHSVLGNRNQEKHYQKAIAIELLNRKIQFEQEKYVPITYEGENIGKYYVDFIINNSIIVETKTTPFLDNTHQNQLLGYMNQLQIQLGFLVNFRSPRLTYKRIVLPDKYYQQHHAFV